MDDMISIYLSGKNLKICPNQEGDKENISSPKQHLGFIYCIYAQLFCDTA